jgi:hypothetical protein
VGQGWNAEGQHGNVVVQAVAEAVKQDGNCCDGCASLGTAGHARQFEPNGLWFTALAPV